MNWQALLPYLGLAALFVVLLIGLIIVFVRLYRAEQRLSDPSSDLRTAEPTPRDTPRP